MDHVDQPNPYQTPQSQIHRETVSDLQLALDKVSFDDEPRACPLATEFVSDVAWENALEIVKQNVATDSSYTVSSY